ncbi:MAG: hypothetical protein KDJ73_10000 [Notoacmeibacter sp.]|nr:hypothetical protein [Notoacmeibacter sp.]
MSRWLTVLAVFATALSTVGTTGARSDGYTKEQANAAYTDGYLGVAEARCGFRIPRAIFHAVRERMYPDGIDRSVQALQLAKQEEAFELYHQDPANFCRLMIAYFGPSGSISPGFLEPR